jgi:hypothetical protein
MNIKYIHLCTSGTHRDMVNEQTFFALGSDWLKEKGMEGTMRDVFEVFCKVILRNCGRGKEEDHKESRLV